MALKEETRKEDQRLRKELQNADIEKFRKVIAPVIVQKPKLNKIKRKH